MTFFKLAQKVTGYLGYMCHKELSQIAQFGHPDNHLHKWLNCA